MKSSYKLFLSYRIQLSLVALLTMACLGALLLYANMVVLEYDTNIVSVDQAPTSSIAIVFGGGMEEDGTQTLMQQDRVMTGGNLYLKQTVQTVMVTGDDGANRFDETSAMYDQLIAYGVPELDTQIDPHGYRTYESCWRAARVYGVKKAIVVSHAFHLPRIRYICESFGISTIGVEADVRVYEDDWMVSVPREILARLKAVWQVEVTKPLPRVTY